MTTPLFHHTFTPLRIDGDRRIVAPEAEWDKVARLNRLMTRPTGKPKGKVRVEIGGDLFEPWEGPTHATDGKQMWKSRCANGFWEVDDDVRHRVFRLIDDCPHVDFYLSTTHLRAAADVMSPDSPGIAHVGWQDPRKNLILGTTVSTQREADDRLPWLLKLPAAKRWVRYVPGSERVDWPRWLPGKRWFNAACEKCGHVGSTEFFLERRYHDDADVVCPKANEVGTIGLVIVSGSLDSPTNLDHVRGVIAQCRAAGVRVWVERLGKRVLMTWREFCKWHPSPPAVDAHPSTIDVVTLRDPHGADPAEWPEDLRAREIL